MSNWLLGLVTVIYAGISIEQLFKGNIPMAIVYAGYTFANIGLYLAL
tara:strand:+ start:199 stop:339 length:141 start_codon:yes stop_codon:yes gene_type:complete